MFVLFLIQLCCVSRSVRSFCVRTRKKERFWGSWPARVGVINGLIRGWPRVLGWAGIGKTGTSDETNRSPVVIPGLASSSRVVHSWNNSRSFRCSCLHVSTITALFVYTVVMCSKNLRLVRGSMDNPCWRPACLSRCRPANSRSDSCECWPRWISGSCDVTTSFDA